MTRKDFKIVASILNDVKDSTDAIAFSKMVSHFCAYLKESNERFDSDKFRREVYKN